VTRPTIEGLEYADVAKTIDHSLLRPELDLDTVGEGVELARRYEVASATVRPADVAFAVQLLDGSDVFVSTVVGFPHGSSTTATKAFEAERALAEGARELDMVLNIGRLKSGRADEVRADIAEVVRVAAGGGVIVKVILENAYLEDAEKELGSRLAEEAGAAFVKTSTGFAPGGATLADLELMRRTVGPDVQVKAAGGVRTLDALLDVLAVGVTRIGATATETILEDFKARKATLAGAAAG
jgi:deoxyribose-phosphate aldolase